jgi:hypothetical protein
MRSARTTASRTTVPHRRVAALVAIALAATAIAVAPRPTHAAAGPSV